MVDKLALSSTEARSESWRRLQRRVAPLVGADLAELRRASLSAVVSALEKYLLYSIRNPAAATEFINRMPDIYKYCNDDIYERPMVAEAYAYIHFVIRYCNWWEVFLELLHAGWLPMRESGVRALDVGAGPGPAAYALVDFWAALDLAVQRLDSEVCAHRLRTPRPEVMLAEKSYSMAHFVHLLSESRGTGGPYGAAVQDFFQLRLTRSRQENAVIRQSLIDRIMDDWEVGPDAAHRMLLEEYPGWHDPERYHLCMIGNFLTQPETLDMAANALREVKRTLPAGGTLIVMGYPKGAIHNRIYTELGRQMTGPTHLQVSDIYSASLDNSSLDVIKAFYVRIGEHVIKLGVDLGKITANWPSGIEGFLKQRWALENSIVPPPFRIEVFRAGNERMSRRWRRRISAA